MNFNSLRKMSRSRRGVHRRKLNNRRRNAENRETDGQAWLIHDAHRSGNVKELGQGGG
jgi:hypothetical protein